MASKMTVTMKGEFLFSTMDKYRDEIDAAIEPLVPDRQKMIELSGQTFTLTYGFSGDKDAEKSFTSLAKNSLNFKAMQVKIETVAHNGAFMNQ